MKAVYGPMMPVWLYYALKARSLFFFNAANPFIRYGGMVMESKKEIYDQVPGDLIPATVLMAKGTPVQDVGRRAADAGIRFPMIVKPDIGMKALGVARVHDEAELIRYAKRIGNDFLVQEMIEAPRELGVFYVRRPDEVRGRITGMVEKEFLSVTGDGRRSLEELVRRKPRAYFQAASLEALLQTRGNTVPEQGEKVMLVPFGSHTRGARFADITHQADDRLTKTIQTICDRIPGFYFGRLDIMFTNLEELREGKGFSVIEVNGAGSEPTHIYDPGHSIWFAWKEIIRHWRFLYQVSAGNKRRGHRYLSWREGKALFQAHLRHEAFLKMLP